MVPPHARLSQGIMARGDDPRNGLSDIAFEAAGNRDRRRRSEPAQDFERASEVELCDSREDHEADVKIGHATFSSICPERRLGAVEIIALSENARNGSDPELGLTTCGSTAAVSHRYQPSSGPPICVELHDGFSLNGERDHASDRGDWSSLV